MQQGSKESTSSKNCSQCQSPRVHNLEPALKTTVTIEIDSEQPIPDGITDVLADRAYGYCHNVAGVRCEVTARLSSDTGSPGLDGKDAGGEGACVAEGAAVGGDVPWNIGRANWSDA